MLNRLLVSKKNPYIPGRNNKEIFNLDLSGAKFSISMPPNSIWDIPEELPKSNQINIYDENLYSPLENLADYRKGTFPVLPLLTRTFGFWGNPFTSSSNIGMVKCFTHVQRVVDAPEGFSCLNPADFEQAINKSIYFNFGPGSGLDMLMLAPVDWEVIDIGRISCVVLDIRKNYEKFDYEVSEIGKTIYSRRFYAPLFNNYLLVINFSVSAYLPLNISKNIVDLFLFELIDTIEYSLGEACEKTYKSYSRQGIALSKFKEPESWIDHTLGRKSSSDKEVIEKHGTPPPQLVATCK